MYSFICTVSNDREHFPFIRFDFTKKLNYYYSICLTKNICCNLNHLSGKILTIIQNCIR